MADARADRSASKEQLVTVGGRALSTTKREYDLIVHLMTHPDQVFTRDVLLEQVWGWKFGDQSTVTVHVKRVRTKLGSASRIETVWGRGYRWVRGPLVDESRPGE